VHKVAWLLSEVPFGVPTHRACWESFGFDGGSGMESITTVTRALQTLAAEHWAHPITFAPAISDTNDPSVAAETGA
jgi:hypothetical protein